MRLTSLTWGFSRDQFISLTLTNHQSYQILFDDPNIGLINVNDCYVMVCQRKKRKTLKKKKEIFFCLLFQSEEPLEQIVLAEKLKTITYGDKNQVRGYNLFFPKTMNCFFFYSKNGEHEDDELQGTDDDDDVASKTDVITKIPDRLLYLIVYFILILEKKIDLAVFFLLDSSVENFVCKTRCH
jgi:hypothetical protein